ncbi:uncharacterized protein F4812DRAFT_433235 [Daldinia caldariorum]|uniref:uncharacterized protein n=1 Tax=Daldinia caldariorum TaxID=326644 RepID=UPI0020087EC8|nr:uncharacterized protein F4812DRAFT_433235 [Daldinia caldariorum]KAI1466917.1 hypothetical protein F4812DRAFT_433235 [Daldinia caldariorum]
MASTTLSLPHPQRQHTLSRSPRKSGIATTSTPNLNSVYSAHSRLIPSSGALARKASFAALTPGSLASIPDDSESYAIDTVLTDSSHKMPPFTPGKDTGDGFDLGDNVEVPGNMTGTIRFVGSVAGRKGTFVGVELHPDYAARGKNSGDVDGVSYFNTSIPGSGIFVPVHKLSKQHDSPLAPSSSLPPTPGLRVAGQNATNYTPTPSLPSFSKSLGPARAPSPQGKRSRPSLPRPESPMRKLTLTPAPPRPMTATPGPRAPSRYGTPTVPKLGASIRGVPGDPSKMLKLDRKPSILPRSASAMGPIFSYDEEETTPVGLHPKANGSIGSASSLSFKRPQSRAAHINEEEIERLKAQLEDRDRQLKDQASTLAEMESSLSELTMLIDQSDTGRMRAGSIDDKDTSQLRTMLREKNEKIATLTAEFDAHRADFRSTIDTLEMASTETQRVYDARIRELEQELHEAQERNVDVDSVARQLKQLEELVQELEEGLEDARRGEAEARGEVEFLRGEVERTRTELRREREKAAAALNGGNNGEDKLSMSKELEQKDDEIRGLKAIIHSLSRDSIPGSDSSEKTPTLPQRSNSLINSRPNSIDNHSAREKLEREVFELRNLIESKSHREEELEREIESLRRAGASVNRPSSATLSSVNRSSYRDSKTTVVVPSHETDSPETTHRRAKTLETTPESDAYSSVTETSTLWCEICETGGHDILTCTNMFGSQNEQGKPAADSQASNEADSFKSLTVPTSGNEEDTPRPLSPMKPKAAVAPSSPPSAAVKILPNPQDSGPLAGKDSGVVDPEKWCALCERDGHDSIDCPLEDAF